MSDKYYTPEIEDLHVGMECEILVATTKSYGLVKLDELRDRDPIAEYEDWQVTRLTPGYINVMHYRVTADGSEDFSVPKNMIRVKYLDRDDVKSLGFTRDQSGNWYKRYGDSDLYIAFHTGDERPIWVELTKEDGAMLFDGKVKNKTELKVILKQIGYER